MRILVTRGLALTAALLITAGGATVVSAATSSPSTSPTPNASSTHAHRLFRLAKVAGKVVSDTSSGATAGAGQLVIKEPDGTSVTLNLASRTKAWKYQGHGVKPVSENPSMIATGEIVVVGVRSVAGSQIAVRILDLGFQAAG
jgi:type IV secretory pathway protease TraF